MAVSFLDILRSMLTPSSAKTGSGSSTEQANVPKSPYFRFSKEANARAAAELDMAQREAAAEYYRGQGYDILPEDLVRNPDGGLSMPDFGRSVKRLKRRQNVISLPQIAEIYKEAK